MTADHSNWRVSTSAPDGMDETQRSFMRSVMQGLTPVMSAVPLC